MSAAGTVLQFRYSTPRSVPMLNPALPKDAKVAQVLLERAISGATLELLRAGFDRAEADCLVRIVAAHVAYAYGGEELPAKVLAVAWQDRMEREGWAKL